MSWLTEGFYTAVLPQQETYLVQVNQTARYLQLYHSNIKLKLYKHPVRLHSPLVYKDEFAIDGVPGDVLGGLHPDVSQAGLGDDVGVQTADGHQAAQVAAFVVGLVVLIEAHFGRRPTLQVTRAVDRAEALAVSCHGREKGETGVKYRTERGL